MVALHSCLGVTDGDGFALRTTDVDGLGLDVDGLGLGVTDVDC